MREIKCPKCGEVFKVDEAGYADIVKQVRNHEFEKELHEREKLLKADKESAVKLAEEQIKNALKDDLAKKDTEVATLKAEKELALTQLGAKKDEELSELKAKLHAIETEKELAVTEAVSKVEKNVDELKAEAVKKDAEIADLKTKKDLALTQLELKKNEELSELKSQLQSAKDEKKLAIIEAVSKVEKERNDLTNKLQSTEMEKKLAITEAVDTLKDNYEKRINTLEGDLKTANSAVALYKDMKTKLSTKMLGETLEQHCEIAFEQLRATGAFRNANFGKDNDASSGSKGDYIYREIDENGVELISIMFEMKNEAETTVTKHKNRDYFKELDKDRKEKKCEYAVLISMLEADSELYSGITDVSHEYPKMYVVRPQFFVPIITLLRNAASGSMKYKVELAVVRSQNIDITNFESELQLFQDGFMKNVKDSSSKFQEAIDGIDATINKLEGVKEALRLSNKHLLTAGNKVETVSVKRLTKNNPTMASKFAELDKNKN